MRPVVPSLVNASASSRRSAVTKPSPAFSASFSAWSRTRASSGRHIDLPGTGAFDLRLLLERLFGGGQRARRIGAGIAQQAGGKAVLVIQQNFQKMFGSEPLMARPQRQGLRSLQESTRPFGELLQIHNRPLSSAPVQQHALLDAPGKLSLSPEDDMGLPNL